MIEGKVKQVTGSERREEIVRMIKESEKAVPAKVLAQQFEVSRQVIVQDIALLRATGYDIVSTNRGYLLQESHAVKRVLKVSHTDEQIEDELCTIVDLGGVVLNVMVNHRVYGHMEAPLRVASRRHIQIFMDDIKSGKSSPLKNITSNYHYHTIEAESEETLDLIEHALREKGYLVEM